MRALWLESRIRVRSHGATVETKPVTIPGAPGERATEEPVRLAIQWNGDLALWRVNDDLDATARWSPHPRVRFIPV
jgi:hypothetical protein